MSEATGMSMNTPNRTSRGPARDGFTLLELLLVLGLLVIIAGLTWPALRGSLGSSRLREAAKMVRVDLAKTRLQAMQSDAIVQWQYSPGDGRFRVGVVREAPLDESEQEALAGGTSTERWTEFRLPDGITFAELELSSEPTIGRSPLLAGQDGEQWSPPIVFYPNGTTSNAEVTLRNEREDTVIISLRGLTGVTRISELPQSRSSMQ